MLCRRMGSSGSAFTPTRLEMLHRCAGPGSVLSKHGPSVPQPRYAFTFNFYPYFDGNMWLDSPLPRDVGFGKVPPHFRCYGSTAEPSVNLSILGKADHLWKRFALLNLPGPPCSSSVIRKQIVVLQGGHHTAAVSPSGWAGNCNAGDPIVLGRMALWEHLLHCSEVTAWARCEGPCDYQSRPDESGPAHWEE